MLIALSVVAVLFICFGLIVFRGAPYVPTHPKIVGRALALAPKSGTLVDLGSGDGTMLIAAAREGRKVHGVELNPFLVFVARLRIRRYSTLASVRLGDFWNTRLPDDASAVFVFLAGPFMSKLERYMHAESNRLGRELILISYGFEMPGLQPELRDGPLVRYRFTPASLQS